MNRTQWMMALIVTFLPTLAVAQLGAQERIVAQVPFEFVVGNRIVPPGQYVVKAAALSETALIFENAGAGVGVVSANFLDETTKPAATYEMVFKKFGSQHFLWKIKIKGSRMTLRLPESRAEAELQAQRVPATAESLLASNK